MCYALFSLFYSMKFIKGHVSESISSTRITLN